MPVAAKREFHVFAQNYEGSVDFFVGSLAEFKGLTVKGFGRIICENELWDRKLDFTISEIPRTSVMTTMNGQEQLEDAFEMIQGVLEKVAH